MKTTLATDFHDYMMVRLNRSGQTDTIPSLPTELICNILSYLGCIDLLRCQLVCKVFRKLIVETSRLSYTIELYKHRMVTVVPQSDHSTYASRLAMLKDRERNWRMLNWRHRCSVDLPPTGSLYEFVGGVYANGKEGANRVTASISFLELPSLGIPSREKDGAMLSELQSWVHIMPEYNIIDFTMDPVQDLLVLVVVAPLDSPYFYDLHVRSIKTNQPHPKAPRSIFPCLLKPSNHPQPVEVVTAVRVQVCGDLVALLIKEVFDNSGGYLEIWNWEHGPSNSCKMPRTNGIDDFTFLTHEVCLIVRPSGRFEVYDFLDPKLRCSEPIMRYAYAFPPLNHGYTYWYISLSSNPTPGYVPSAHEQNNMDNFLNGHQQIHYPDPKERVHACCLYVFNPQDPVLQAVSSFVFFVKIDTLLNPPFNWFDPTSRLDDDPTTPYFHSSIFKEEMARISAFPPHTRPELAPIDLTISNLPSVSATVLPSLSPSSPSSSSSSSSSSSASTPTPQEQQDSTLSPQSSPFLSSSSLLQPQSQSQSQPQHPNIVPIPASLLDSIQTFTPGQPGDGTIDPALCEPVAWDIWGPSNTRWFEESLSTDWQHAIYGMRAVESVETTRMAEERNFAIHEWPPSSRRGDDRESQSTEGMEDVEDEVQPRGHRSSGSGEIHVHADADAGVKVDVGVDVDLDVDVDVDVDVEGVDEFEASSSHSSSPSHGASSSSSSSSQPHQPQAQPQPQNQAQGPPAIQPHNPFHVPQPDDDASRREKRFLRMRDFSPYALTRAARSEALSHPVLHGKGKCRGVWRTPKVVREASRVCVNGVFKEDIMSSLPYVETVTDETFDVTDVMMDDCRLLLLKRGNHGRIKSMEVLMM
ncbi:hypothetical protein FA15DRAFT_622483 [Coprinopsis marcescibilis]|uniref:F-box domain-containing protein n=1 Tax=Coprinopsis marcescibilis TaxID=230819 RepID=A0A5C3L2S6_COPMA|nr:hypothetical protein FA15DRAFT_622483 [Coprinopsis marcescibilis]